MINVKLPDVQLLLQYVQRSAYKNERPHEKS